MEDSKCCGKKNRGEQGGGCALSVQFQKGFQIGLAEVVISEQKLMEDGCLVVLPGKLCRVNSALPHKVGVLPASLMDSRVICLFEVV